MVNRNLKLIKDQSERSFEKDYTTPTSFTPRPLHKSIDIFNGDKNHKAASLFFAHLRETCRNSK